MSFACDCISIWLVLDGSDFSFEWTCTEGARGFSSHHLDSAESLNVPELQLLTSLDLLGQ